MQLKIVILNVKPFLFLFVIVTEIIFANMYINAAPYLAQYLVYQLITNTLAQNENGKTFWELKCEYYICPFVAVFVVVFDKPINLCWFYDHIEYTLFNIFYYYKPDSITSGWSDSAEEVEKDWLEASGASSERILKGYCSSLLKWVYGGGDCISQW